MFSLLVFAVLCTSCLADPAPVHYSFSRAVGGGSGTSFATDGEGRITAVKLWEAANSYITGIQLQYESIWSALIGRINGHVHEMKLYNGEHITQISGKYDKTYIYQLIFVTSRGRSLVVGQPTQISFNMYAAYEDAELRMLSGRFNSAGITSVAAHWGAVYMEQSNNTAMSRY